MSQQNVIEAIWYEILQILKQLFYIIIALKILTCDIFFQCLTAQLLYMYCKYLIFSCLNKYYM